MDHDYPKQQYIELEAQAHYWQSLHSRAKARIEDLEQELLLRDAKIKDLQNRLFGKNPRNSIRPRRSKAAYRGQQRETSGYSPVFWPWPNAKAELDGHR